MLRRAESTGNPDLLSGFLIRINIYISAFVMAKLIVSSVSLKSTYCGVAKIRPCGTVTATPVISEGGRDFPR